MSGQGRSPSLLTEPCKVCGAAPAESCPTEIEPLCGELRPDGAPCIRSAGHGRDHRATCLPAPDDASSQTFGGGRS